MTVAEPLSKGVHDIIRLKLCRGRQCTKRDAMTLTSRKGDFNTISKLVEMVLTENGK